MAQPFYVTLSNAGYPQYPNLFVARVLEGFGPGSPPARPTPQPPVYPSHPIYLPPYPDQGLPGLPPYPDNTLPQPPLGIWGPNDPRPTHPIVLPPGGAIPPLWIALLPSQPGEPGSPSNPYPPGSELPVHPSTGLNTFYMVIPYVGVVGPFTMPPGVATVPEVPEVPPDAVTKPGGEKPPITLPGTPPAGVPPAGTPPPQAPRR